MLLNYAGFFSEWLHVSGIIQAGLGEAPEGPVGDSAAEAIRLTLDKLATNAAFADLDMVRKAAVRCSLSINGSTSCSAVAAMLEDVRQRIADELGTRQFYYVNSRFAPYYEQPLAGWDGVTDKFPAAIPDIEDAGKCLALGRGTACVFHLMRVMEVGLMALARRLGIPYAPSWESYLTQINNKIAEKRKKKGVRWKRDEPVFRDISGDLQTVKVAWRNPTMHVRRRYEADEAEEVFRAVRGFMRRLAPICPGPAAPSPAEGATDPSGTVQWHAEVGLPLPAGEFRLNQPVTLIADD